MQREMLTDEVWPDESVVVEKDHDRATRDVDSLVAQASDGPARAIGDSVNGRTLAASRRLEWSPLIRRRRLSPRSASRPATG